MLLKSEFHQRQQLAEAGSLATTPKRCSDIRHGVLTLRLMPVRRRPGHLLCLKGVLAQTWHRAAMRAALQEDGASRRWDQVQGLTWHLPGGELRGVLQAYEEEEACGSKQQDG